MKNQICQHCGFPIAIRNPTGFCDHLYYPEYCKVCEVGEFTLTKLLGRK